MAVETLPKPTIPITTPWRGAFLTSTPVITAATVWAIEDHREGLAWRQRLAHVSTTSQVEGKARGQPDTHQRIYRLRS